ncbi:MAG: hypothetical protein PHF64_00145 [Methanoregula sp.]|nr:hypothetical protein [Methanoregula sp.]
MKIAVNTKCKVIVLDVSEKTGGLISALAEARLYDNQYKNGRYVYVPAGTEESPEQLSIEFISEADLSEPTPMIDDLTKALKRSESRWLDEYSKRIKAEKELWEIKSKIDDLKEEKK